MPYLYSRIGEMAQRVIDPVTEQLVYTFLDRLGARSYFPQSIYIFNKRSAASRTDDGSGNYILSCNRCDVTVTTHYGNADQMWDMLTNFNSPAHGMSKMYNNQYQNVINDPVNQVSVQEITEPFGLTLEFELSFQGYDSAQLIFSALKSQQCNQLVTDVQDIVYTYPVDFVTLSALYQVYKRTDAAINKTQTFMEYIKSVSREHIQTDINRYDIGKGNPDTQLVFKKTQLNCQTMLTFDQDEPEADMYEKAAVGWVVRCTLRIQFGRPNILQLSLPCVVNNSLLPSVFFKKASIGNYRALEGHMQTRVFDVFMRDYMGGINGDIFTLRLPEYDDWSIPNLSLVRAFKFNPIMIAVVLLDGETTTIDLNELGDVELSPFVKEMLAQIPEEDVFAYTSLFNITIFENDVAVDSSCVTWDPTTLQIQFKASDKTKSYRLVFSEATNFKRVAPKWYDLMLKYRYYFPMTVYRNLDYLTKLGYYTVESDNQLLKLINLLRKTGRFQSVVSAMVNSGEVESYIYSFTQTSEQFADYISNTRANVLKGETGDDKYQRTVFDVFCDTCISNGYITESQRPKLYIMTPRGYPYSNDRGGFSDFSTPLRIWNVNVTGFAKRS